MVTERDNQTKESINKFRPKTIKYSIKKTRTTPTQYNANESNSNRWNMSCSYLNPLHLHRETI